MQREHPDTGSEEETEQKKKKKEKKKKKRKEPSEVRHTMWDISECVTCHASSTARSSSVINRRSQTATRVQLVLNHDSIGLLSFSFCVCVHALQVSCTAQLLLHTRHELLLNTWEVHYVGRLTAQPEHVKILEHSHCMLEGGGEGGGLEGCGLCRDKSAHNTENTQTLGPWWEGSGYRPLHPRDPTPRPQYPTHQTPCKT